MQQLEMMWDKTVSPERVVSLFLDREGWLTRRQVAQGLMCSKSPTLVKLLTELVARGVLEEAFSYSNGGLKMRHYRMTEAARSAAGVGTFG